jgi:hypothetical protein
VKRLKNFINRSGETEAARQIVRRAERQNRQRNTAIHDLPRSFVHRAVASGRDYEIHWPFEGFFPASLFYRMIERLMPGPDQTRYQLFLAVLTISRFRIVDQHDSHDWFPTAIRIHNLFGQKQAGTRC